MYRLWVILTLAVCACGGDTVKHILDSPTGTGSGAAPGIYITSVNNSITVYPLDASGSAAPIRTISGIATGLALPIGIVVDQAGEVFVANRMGAMVSVFAPNADGNVAPSRTLTAPGMMSPEPIAFGTTGDIYTSTCPSCGESDGGDTGVYHFPAGATTPDITITGTSTGIADPDGIAVDASGNLIVANAFGGQVLTFAPGATGNATPTGSFTPTGDNIQSMAVGKASIALTTPGAVVDFYDPAATGNPDANPIGMSSMVPLAYPGGVVIDTSVTPTTIYLVDVSAGSLYIIETAGVEPDLSVASVRMITGLISPLDVAVSH
jgi:hypothetical protein